MDRRRIWLSMAISKQTRVFSTPMPGCSSSEIGAENGRLVQTLEQESIISAKAIAQDRLPVFDSVPLGATFDQLFLTTVSQG